MITLFTGQPGNGKTAACVDFLSKLVGDRPLFVDGLNGLVLDHEPLDVRQWHTVVPDGAVVVVDEVQRRWRAAGRADVSDDIAALETHRHRGIDFYIITQGPALIHKNVRDLVGRHVHIRDVGVLGRWWYEWPECSPGVAWRTAPIKRKYRLPKKAFDLYKSASIHTKPVRSRPWYLVAVPILLVLAIWGALKVRNSIQAKIEPAKPVAPAVGPGGLVGGPPVPAPITAASLRRASTPRIAAQPNSAPLYDELRKPVAMPRIQGGYCQAGQCYCFIQNGLRAPIDAKACYEWLKNPPFDPYYLAPGPAAAASAPQA